MTMSVNSRDKKLIALVASTLCKLDDFKDKAPAAAEEYATDIIAALRSSAESAEDFKDHAMGIVANVKNLNGEISAQNIAAAELAGMDAAEMLSRKQRSELARFTRKRAREQTNYDKTSMLCTKCGLVRRDRLNINEIALDSEENGTQFDYNFDNTCSCSQSSSSSDSEKEDGHGDALAQSSEAIDAEEASQMELRTE